MTRRIRSITPLTAFSLALCGALAGCYTGGGTAPPPPGSVTTTLPSGGIYKGTVNGGQADATLLMLFNGTAYLFYGSANNATGMNLNGVAVATNGTQSGDGRFTSTSAMDYRVGRSPAAPAEFVANFANAPAVDGTVASKNGGAGLAFKVSAASMLDTGPSDKNAGGLYNGRGMSLNGATNTRLTVAADGYAAGTTTSGCIFKGTVTPQRGANAYDVTVTFGPAPCPLPDATVKGSAVLDGPRLLVALPSADRSNVFLFDGRK